ncbi:MAG: alcohol dehydrogenase catalytic domain-containing protein [Armatimonadetes bacterium]|nr:alcohol dehydrogenase catalytic domain-containing protein [Armatimonadota bacterium]
MLVEPGRLELQSVPVPATDFSEILIRVEAATTCGTDLKAFRRGHPQIPMPGVLGHEYSGVVAEAGVGAQFLIGEAVMGVHSAPCRQCRWCERGQENLCESIMETKVLGSYAEFLLVPARIANLHVFRKPDTLSFALASLLEPLSCVMQGIRSFAHKEHSDVLVIGPGAVGLMFVAALRKLGMASVSLLGRNEARLEVGAGYGSETLKWDDVGGRTWDLVIECTGTVEVWERSIGLVRRGGTAVLFGGCPSGTKASFDTKTLHYGQVDVLSPFHFGTDAVQDARRLLLDTAFDLSPLLSGTRTLEEGPQVFQDLADGKGIKYVFTP